MSQTKKPRLVVTDTDIDGLSGAVNAYLALREENPLIYSHFRAPQGDTQPGTQAAVFNPQEVLNYLNADVEEVITIDIPPPRELPRRAQIVSFIQQLRSLGVNYRIYDVFDHAEPQYWQQLKSAGADLRLVPDGYSVKLLPAIDYLGRIETVMERWALVGSIADFDESVASRTSIDLERIIAEEVDAAYKFGQWPVQPSEVRMYGKTGAIAKYIVERLDADPERFINMAQEIYKSLPQNQKLPQQVQYRRIGSVALAEASQVPPGLQWKLAWKVAWATNTDVAVIYGVRQQRGSQEYHGIIVASYWRSKSRVANVIDQVVSEIAGRMHASVVGHVGARSLMWPAGAVDTLRVAEEIASMISQRIWTPAVTHLVSDSVVASAVREDYARIMTTLTQILERMERMYSEYLELKRRQVELLERATGTSTAQRARYD